MKLGVIFWTGTGNTEAMANLVAEGAKEAGAEVEVLNVSETDVESALGFDRLALGCPAMGDEALEEGEFEPFYSELKEKLGDKPVVLFGSYSWAEGAWMETWVEDAKTSGLNLVAEGLICFESPEDEKVDACRQLGAQLAQA